MLVWPTHPILALFALLLAYLLGSLLFSVLISRSLGRDVREHDFAGTSGITRQYGLLPGVATFILDAAKGGIAVWIVHMISPEVIVLAPAMVILGHCWPVLFGFRGGQGLAPLLGAMAVLAPSLFLIGLPIGLFGLGLHRWFKLKRIVKISAVPFGAIVGIVIGLVISLSTHFEPTPVLALLFATFVLIIRGVSVLLQEARP